RRHVPRGRAVGPGEQGRRGRGGDQVVEQHGVLPGGHAAEQAPAGLVALLLQLGQQPRAGLVVGGRQGGQVLGEPLQQHVGVPDLAEQVGQPLEVVAEPVGPLLVEQLGEGPQGGADPAGGPRGPVHPPPGVSRAPPPASWQNNRGVPLARSWRSRASTVASPSTSGSSTSGPSTRSRPLRARRDLGVGSVAWAPASSSRSTTWSSRSVSADPSSSTSSSRKRLTTRRPSRTWTSSSPNSASRAPAGGRTATGPG